MLKNNKGITLLALIITIIVLVIIGVIGIRAGRDSIKASKDNKLLAEIDMVQHAVFETYTKYKVTNDRGLLVGTRISYSEVKNTADKMNVVLPEEITYYKLTSNDLKRMGLEESEFEYIVNYPNGIVMNATVTELNTGEALYKDTGKIITAESTDDYVELEYIKSTGEQYIDTGVNPADTVDFEMTFKTDVQAMTVDQIQNVDPKKVNAFFGCSDDTQKRILSINFGARKNEMRIHTWKNNTYSNGAADIPFNTTIYDPRNKLTISCINDEWKVNGNKTGTSASVGAWRIDNQTLYVFGVNYTGTARTFYENMYLYSLKIWDSGELIRDFIPVHNKATNTAGLYDLQGRQFYENKGTGEFIEGAR